MTKTKVFISYCDNDGLKFASIAADVLEANGHEAWYFDRDKSPGILRIVDITKHIREWCDKVLYICTNGSISSNGQWKEIGQWDSTNKQMIVIPIDTAIVPDVIDPYIYARISSNDFGMEFNDFIQNRWEDITRAFEEWSSKIKIKNQ